MDSCSKFTVDDTLTFSGDVTIVWLTDCSRSFDLGVLTLLDTSHDPIQAMLDLFEEVGYVQLVAVYYEFAKCDLLALPHR